MPTKSEKKMVKKPSHLRNLQQENPGSLKNPGHENLGSLKNPGQENPESLKNPGQENPGSLKNPGQENPESKEILVNKILEAEKSWSRKKLTKKFRPANIESKRKRI